MNNNFLHTKIYAKIKAAKNILLISHIKPDGDTLGSACAMMEVLDSMGKKFIPFCATEIPMNFIYLPYIEKFISDKNKLDFPDFDLILVYDCGDLSRTKLSDEINSRGKNQYVINVDHHPKVDDFANLEIKSDSASTTELVYDFFKANKIPINKNIATSILTGISVDTNNFLYQSTTDRTVNISSELLAHGASLPKIMEKTMRNKKLSSLKLWGLAMSRLKINPKYNLAFTILTYDEIKNAAEEDLDGIANYLGNLEDVAGVITLMEKENGVVKGSIRSSHPTQDMSVLARQFGGGGHTKASGFEIQGQIKLKGEKWEIV